MKSIYLLLILSLAIIACKSKSPSDAKAAEDAITRVKEHPGDSAYIALDTILNQYIEMKGYGDSTSAKLLVDAARALNGANQPAHAMRYYNRYMAHYPGRSDQADKLIEATAVVQKLNKPELNDIAYKSFANRFPNDPRATEILGKITTKDITIDSTLNYLGMNIFIDSSFRLNEPMTRLYIEACELAVAADPSVPNAPEHLLRAAETAKTIREINRSIDLYSWIIEVYPEHPRASTSLFLKAFTYDNELQEYEKAGHLYNEFLTTYPNNEYAESAQVLLKNLGKSDEEWLKLIEKNKQAVQ
jgi:tetratricopeptide (TPR) repeat protein